MSILNGNPETRYLYVPIGGTQRAILATLTVFTFVALWHDLSLRLLTWGWVISLFVLPEMAGKTLVPVAKVSFAPPFALPGTCLIRASQYGKNWWYRHLAAVGGVANVLLMMTANLIGFAIGTDGMSYMWSQMIGTWAGKHSQIPLSFVARLIKGYAGIKFMFIASGCLFVGVQLMFEYREEELRKGIVRRC